MISKFNFQLSNFSQGKFAFIGLALTLAVWSSLFDAAAQRRDHLTAMEVELVREAQQIDLRMKVFVKAIDRRFLVLNKDTSQAKQIEKDLESWGELPTGTRAQLLIDIENLFDEAISKIDDVASRDMGSDYFPDAVHTLADAAKRHLPQLKSEFEKSTDETEKGALLGAIDSCEQIIEASAKVKRESPKEIKKRKDKETKKAQEKSDSN